MASRDKKPGKPSSSRAGGIRTLSDLNRRSGPDSDSDSDSPQEYYTSGEKIRFSMPVIVLPCDPVSAAMLEFVFSTVVCQKLHNLFNQPADVKSVFHKITLRHLPLLAKKEAAISLTDSHLHRLTIDCLIAEWILLIER
ncbi:hypothetical protein CCACVL1_22459 [Corchorus capsularis]|uniref:Uncharacterized protein n=1 Tax=Corchorus capsularis TaxID=210143 RepID=A0A1R3GYH4_COCAP|nr:hypothetical protein CCACVL1_22459 [Corchorus capsularis]